MFDYHNIIQSDLNSIKKWVQKWALICLFVLNLIPELSSAKIIAHSEQGGGQKFLLKK